MKKLLLLLFSLMLSFNSYGKGELDFSSADFCYKSSKTQLRQGLYYLPNQEKPYSGENLCTYLSNGQYHSQGYIARGLQEGTWNYWYENGEKKPDILFDDGEKVNKLDAIIIERLYENGNPEWLKSYENDMKNGEWIEWHENGQMSIREFYIDDKLDGIQKIWREDGSIGIEQSYKDGKKNGKTTRWYPNGIKDNEYNSLDDILHGEETYWDMDGNMTDFNTYDYGRFEYSSSFYPNGQMKYETKYKKGTDKEWFENGQLKEEGQLLLNEEGRYLKNGKWTKWDDKGNVISEIIYKDGELSEDYKAKLQSAYVNNISAWVKTFWRYQSAEKDWTAEVYIIQDRNGNVQAVDVRGLNVGNSSLAKSFMDSIERAVYKASPLPGAPDEAVFDKELYFIFSVN